MSLPCRCPAAVLTLSLLAPVATAHAQDDALRELCPDRPGLGTPACIVDGGRGVVELGSALDTLYASDHRAVETIGTVDLLVRLGLTHHTEVQAAWTPFLRSHLRNRASGEDRVQTGWGDATLAVRRNLRNPAGTGLSIAVMPYVDLPVGKGSLGAGTWSSGVILPTSYELNPRIAIALSPEVAMTADVSRHGRHLRYGTILGTEILLLPRLAATAEVAVLRDQDPEGASTAHQASLAFALKAGPHLQLDAGAITALNQRSAFQLYLGVARRF